MRKVYICAIRRTFWIFTLHEANFSFPSSVFFDIICPSPWKWLHYVFKVCDWVDIFRRTDKWLSHQHTIPQQSYDINKLINNHSVRKMIAVVHFSCWFCNSIRKMRPSPGLSEKTFPQYNFWSEQTILIWKKNNSPSRFAKISTKKRKLLSKLCVRWHAQSDKFFLKFV